jgi:hypothetical protein
MADYGTTLGGHPIIFDLSTYNVLPDNMSFGSPSIPIVGWSIIVGQYQASGVGGTGSKVVVDLLFDTNSVGLITASNFVVGGVTSTVLIYLP